MPGSSRMPSHSPRLLLALALLLLAVGCRSATEPSFEARRELELARERWAAAGVHDYDYELGRGSAWFFEHLRIEVRGDQVVSATRLDIISPVPPGSPVGTTVPQL